MGTISPFHWLFFLIDLALLAAVVIASARILHRLGYSRWWVMLGFVPIANVMGLWILSKAAWPKVQTS